MGWAALVSSLRRAVYRDDLAQTGRRLGETKSKSFLQTAEICHSAVFQVNLRFRGCYPVLTPLSTPQPQECITELDRMHSNLACSAHSPLVFRALFIGATSATTPAVGTNLEISQRPCELVLMEEMLLAASRNLMSLLKNRI